MFGSKTLHQLIRWVFPHKETYTEYVSREMEILRKGGEDINPYNADPEVD